MPKNLCNQGKDSDLSIQTRELKPVMHSVTFKDFIDFNDVDLQSASYISSMLLEFILFYDVPHCSVSVLPNHFFGVEWALDFIILLF